MTKSINTRQLCLILIMSVCSLKFLFLPSLLSVAAKQSLFISCIVNFSIEFVFLFVFIKFMKLYPDKTFYDVASSVIGKVAAKIFYFFLAIFFGLKTILCLIEVQVFFGDNLFDYLNIHVFVVPVFIVLLYIAKSGLRSFGRVLQLFFYIIVLCVAFVLFTPIVSADYTNILPLFEGGGMPILNSVTSYNFWFGDYLILFLLCGRVALCKNWSKKVIWSYIIACVVIIVFMIAFYCIFTTTSGLYRMAISDMSEYLPKVPGFGRLDWITVVAWSFALILQCGFGLYLAYKSFSYLVPHKNGNLALMIVTASVLGVLILNEFDFSKIIELMVSLKYFSLGIQVFSPILICFCMGLYKKRRNKYAQKSC